MLFNGLACVSIAVKSIKDALPAYTEGLGLDVVSEIQTSQRGFGLRWIVLGKDGKGFLELLEPTGENSLIQRFLSREGPSSVYQIRFHVDDLDTALSVLTERGLKVSRGNDVPGQPRVGWVHPASTHGALIELIEGDQE